MDTNWSVKKYEIGLGGNCSERRVEDILILAFVSGFGQRRAA